MSEKDLERDKLNLETGRIQWPELQRYFAKGVIIDIDTSLDLVEVAQQFVRDNKTQIEEWIASGQVCRATDDHAKRWHGDNSEFWAIVVTPWVLVQQIHD